MHLQFWFPLLTKRTCVTDAYIYAFKHASSDVIRSICWQLCPRIIFSLCLVSLSSAARLCFVELISDRESRGAKGDDVAAYNWSTLVRSFVKASLMQFENAAQILIDTIMRIF